MTPQLVERNSGCIGACKRQGFDDVEVTIGTMGLEDKCFWFHECFGLLKARTSSLTEISSLAIFKMGLDVTSPILLQGRFANCFSNADTFSGEISTNKHPFTSVNRPTDPTGVLCEVGTTSMPRRPPMHISAAATARPPSLRSCADLTSPFMIARCSARYT